MASFADGGFSTQYIALKATQQQDEAMNAFWRSLLHGGLPPSCFRGVLVNELEEADR